MKNILSILNRRQTSIIVLFLALGFVVAGCKTVAPEKTDNTNQGQDVTNAMPAGDSNVPEMIVNSDSTDDSGHDVDNQVEAFGGLAGTGSTRVTSC